nr:RNA-directed DNA polymerase, eukaryota [Tanacetum cinerariifolium]
MWLWIEFESNEACLKLQENKEVSWYFTHLKHIQHTFILDERVVWIEISGLSLNAWTPNAFKKIAESWGDPLFVDEDPNEIVSIGRVCIKTKIHGHINETYKVIILGKAYNVSVKEFTGWTPDIKYMDATSGYNSESDKSEKLEEALDENGPFDKEEGEIPKDEPNEEHEFDINTQWADANVSQVPKQENFSTEFPTSSVAKNEKEESRIVEVPSSPLISHPPRLSHHVNRGSPKHPSHFSSAPVKSSRVSKSQTKSFGNHGSMIEAFVSHIEMGNVLGYDMEGSKNDLKKFIDSLGVKQGGLASIWDPNAFSKVNEFHFEHLLIVEDFNVVRWASERFGTTFNHASAKAFNRFIRDAQLWEVPLGGQPDCFFQKQNKDFKGCHQGMELETKRSCDLRRDDLIKKIKDFDSNIVSQNADFPADSHPAAWIDRLRVIDFNENVDASQKAKIKWDIEADENSKFFHAIVNQKRRYLSIQGVKVDGIWIDDPSGIKGAFHSFFEKKFQKIDVVKMANRSPFYKSLTPEQNTLLTSPILETDIKDAIWDCGSDKSPGPDGFTFAFYKEFWNVVKKDILAFVGYFFTTVPCPMMISDFHPLSLIGAQYKIIAKVLANRLARVIDIIISPEQSAFIKQRQILDGPLMVNEVIQWCKRKKSKLMVMHFMGFNETWVEWISGCLHSASASILINGSPTCEFNSSVGILLLASSPNDSPNGKLLFYPLVEEPLSSLRFYRLSNTLLTSPILETDIKDAIWDCGSDKSPRPDGFTFAFYKEFWNVVKKDILAFVGYFFTTGIIPRGCNTSFITLIPKVPCPMVMHSMSPTCEFNILRGLRQGDPLSPFLFIIAMEGLHVAMEDAMAAGLPIDCNMALVKSWDPIIGKFSKRLTKWKASLLSIGGRTTLFSSVLGALDDGSETRWNRFVPRKVNVFIWRALRDRLPTRWNLSRRGVEIASITCPICDNEIDTSYHTLWVYSLATSLWIRVFKWLEFNPPVIPNLRGIFTWIEELHISSNKKAITEVVCSVVLWALWNFRNDMIFGDIHPKCSILYNKVVDFSFRWYSSRNKLSSISWSNWIQNPIEVYTL